MSGLPSAGRVERERGPREGGAVRGPGVLGPAGAGVRRSCRTCARRGSRPCGARGEPDRPDLHARPPPPPSLARELVLLPRGRAVVALGAFAWDGALRALGALGHAVRPRPRFGHGSEAAVGDYRLVGSFHPSQQNTFTGKLTEPMLEDVLRRARELAR